MSFSKKFPKICFESYGRSLALESDPARIPEKKINLCFSGGGNAAMYASGVGLFLDNLISLGKIEINRIYSASAGAIVGILFLLIIHRNLLEEKYRITVSDFIHLMNTNFREKFERRTLYLADCWLEMIREIIPPDFYLLCNDRLFITVHFLKINCCQVFKKEVISQFESNEHLLNTIRCSSSIPFITINSLFSKYTQSNAPTRYCVDGVSPIITDYEYPTLYINISHNKYHYSLSKRLGRRIENSYEPIMIEGLRDAYLFFAHNKSVPTIYYYKRNHKQAKKSSSYGKLA